MRFLLLENVNCFYGLGGCGTHAAWTAWTRHVGEGGGSGMAVKEDGVKWPGNVNTVEISGVIWGYPSQELIQRP